MSNSNICKMPTQPSITVGKALTELKVAQDRKTEAEFCFEESIRALVAAENRLFFAKLKDQAKYRE